MRKPIALGALAVSLGMTAPAAAPGAVPPRSLNLTLANVEHFYETQFGVSPHWTHQRASHSTPQEWQSNGCAIGSVDSCNVQLGGSATNLHSLFLTAFIFSGGTPSDALAVIEATVNRFAPGARQWAAQTLTNDVGGSSFVNHAAASHSTSRYTLEIFTVAYRAQDAISLVLLPGTRTQ